jgi:hypothetical protein
MTEAEWLACDDPIEMLKYLRGPHSLREEVSGIFTYLVEVDAPGLTSKRKLRLAACACCRRIWHLLCDRRSQELIETNEQFAEGIASAEHLAFAHIKASEAYESAKSVLYSEAAKAVLGLREWLDVERLRPIRDVIRRELSESYVRPELIAQSDLIRDVVGNLFRPVIIAPEWHTDTAIIFARQMYESRDFSAMPILADALQDAGCDNTEILNHCRADEVHVRGCWIVDLLLGMK